MARLPKYTDQQILDAAHRLICDGGPHAATIAAIAAALGAPSRSIYHRFRSRDVLLGRVWLDAIASFQLDYLERARDPQVTAGQLAAHVIDWVRRHPDTARLLTMYRREEFLAAGVPEELGARARALGREVQEGIEALATRWCGDARSRHRSLIQAAVIGLPYGLVRARLTRGEPIPAHLSRLARVAADAMLQEGTP